MHILGAGRSAFLEFLRNLTPTVLLVSATVFLHARLDFTRIDLSNWVLTLSFFGCLATAFLSMVANIFNFVDAAFGPPFDYARALRRLSRRGHGVRTLAAAMIPLTWRNRRQAFLEAIVALMVVHAALFGAAISATNAATSALRNGLR